MSGLISSLIGNNPIAGPTGGTTSSTTAMSPLGPLGQAGKGISAASQSADVLSKFLPFLQMMNNQGQQQQQMQQLQQNLQQQPKPLSPQLQFPSAVGTGGDPNVGARGPNNMAIQQLLKLLLQQGQSGGLS